MHGVKYECVATKIYEFREDEEVIEFGLMPHPEIEYIGASPDGITKSGRMLEIKVPYSREITGVPLIHYWMQMQTQLQVCSLKECDFVECQIEEYESVEDYLTDVWVDPDTGEEDYQFTADGMEKGCLVWWDDLRDKRMNHYSSPMGMQSHVEMETWIAQKLTEIAAEDNFEKARRMFMPEEIHPSERIVIFVQYWKLQKYSKTVVKRDDTWWNLRTPDFERCWNKILKYRLEGLPDSLKVKAKKRRKKCLIVIDSDNDYSTTTYYSDSD